MYGYKGVQVGLTRMELVAVPTDRLLGENLGYDQKRVGVGRSNGLRLAAACGGFNAKTERAVHWGARRQAFVILLATGLGPLPAEPRRARLDRRSALKDDPTCTRQLPGSSRPLVADRCARRPPQAQSGNRGAKIDLFDRGRHPSGG